MNEDENYKACISELAEWFARNDTEITREAEDAINTKYFSTREQIDQFHKYLATDEGLSKFNQSLTTWRFLLALPK